MNLFIIVLAFILVACNNPSGPDDGNAKQDPGSFAAADALTGMVITGHPERYLLGELPNVQRDFIIENSYADETEPQLWITRPLLQAIRLPRGIPSPLPLHPILMRISKHR